MSSAVASSSTAQPSIFQITSSRSSAASSSSTAGAASSSTHIRRASHYVHLSGHSSTSLSAGRSDEDEYEEDDLDSSSSKAKLATPGQVLGAGPTFMRGHGTHLLPSATGDPNQPSIASSLTGQVVLTNRLLSLQPFYARYGPETGDLVLGRVMAVLPGARRWRINLGGTSYSNLALSSINLPGGIQRRKAASDELQMRTFFKKGDLLVAEVQGVYGDGTSSLHTRSLRYGKLRNGLLVTVPSRLVRRGKSHFVKLQRQSTATERSQKGFKPEEVEMILGLNGWIWLSAVGAMRGEDSTASSSSSNPAETPTAPEQQGRGGQGVGRDVDAGGTYSDQLRLASPQTLDSLSLLSSVLQILAMAYLPISDQTVQKAWDIAVENDSSSGARGRDETETVTEAQWASIAQAIRAQIGRGRGKDGSVGGGGTGEGGSGNAAGMDEGDMDVDY